MDRVSTAMGYQSVLVNLMSAESAQNTAQQQVATGKLGSDLSTYSAQDEALVATKSLQARVQAHIANASALSSQLTVQSQALTSLDQAAQGVKTAVQQAIALGDGTTLLTSLQTQMSSAVSALNTQYDGQYLFSGGATSTPPVSVTSLSQLTTGLPGVFANGSVPQVSRLDDSTTVATGVTASAVATPLFSVLQQVQAYATANPGAFSPPLSAADQSFLQGLLTGPSPNLGDAVTTAQNAAAETGVIQQQVTAAQTALQDQATTLTTTLGDLTDADAAQAATNLQLAQTAVQASAQVFATLKSSSLVSLLSGTTTG